MSVTHYDHIYPLFPSSTKPSQYALIHSFASFSSPPHPPFLLLTHPAPPSFIIIFQRISASPIPMRVCCHKSMDHTPLATFLNILIITLP